MGFGRRGRPGRRTRVTRVAVVSVLYGRGPGQELWARALDRVGRDLTGDDQLDVVAVDNTDRDDGSSPIPHGSHLIRSGRNVGFAAGCNRGLEMADGSDIVVLLNPDVELSDEFLPRLLQLEWPE